MCAKTEQVTAYALGVLSAQEAATIEAHFPECRDCRRELEAIRPTLDSLAEWPSSLLRPSTSLWDDLVARIADQPDTSAPSCESQWEEAAPGVYRRVIADQTDRVCMLVRLAPGADYPPHRHMGVEELHLLQGELWIDGRKLYPGDYNRAARGTTHMHVHSDTGCSCVLIASPSDVLL